MADLHEMGAAEAARRIRKGELSPAELLAACLARIDAVEPRVRAWVHVDRDGASAIAGERSRQARATASQALHGVPWAAKDVLDAAGLPTTAGAPAFAHRRPDADATAVARLRGAGAVLVGKVSTTAFAFLDPTATRNPWNLEHTPGGSSSGPAAAVAARMVPLALGTQTVGSVLRPAAYCGVVGFKPTHGRIGATGVVPLAASLDHVGIFARSVEDAALALSVLAGFDPADPFAIDAPVDDYLAAVARPRPPRLGVLRELIERASPDLGEHLRGVLKRCASAGAEVVAVDLPPSFARVHDAAGAVVRAEAAAHHKALFDAHGAEYPPRVREAIAEGRALRAMDYVAALETRRAFRREMAAAAAPFDALVLPVASGPAPRGLESTGDPSFCAPWSFVGFPAIAIPTGLDAARLPLSAQLVAGPFAEARLLGAAAWCEGVAAFAGSPAL